MIEHLRGTLLSRSAGHVVIEVGGVGYGLTVTAATAESIGSPGDEVGLWVRTWVREDALRLYGFNHPGERDLFDLTTQIPGVGPGIALALLSSMSIGEILQAAVSGDARRFKLVKGIGQKMAEKLVLELKGRADKLAAGLSEQERASVAIPEEALGGSAAREAVMALESLDVRPLQARRAVFLAVETLGPGATVEQLVREGLKHRRSQ